MTRILNVGLIGCGNISTAYLTRAPNFKGIKFTSVADVNPAAAEERAGEFGLRHLSVQELLADPTIDLVLNLTVPAAHFEVSKAALRAGKHVYSEKPFVLSLAEGQELSQLAASRGLRVGSAPDTILGASHQLARALIDDGRVGKIASGTCFVMSHGMESWHPNPDFFFAPGGGPILDLGPYYIANLVQLLGPVARVTALSSTPSATRTIGSGVRKGETVPVTTPTTIHALLEFRSGAVITFATSWDVWQHDLGHMALYGTDGTIHLPDPNFFDGTVRITKGADSVELPEWDHPLGPKNRTLSWGDVADYRTAGLADMALAIVGARPHRCNDAFALHVVDVMTGILAASEGKRFVEMTTTCDRPEPLGPDAARELLA